MLSHGAIVSGVNRLKKDNMNDIIMVDEEFVDISSGKTQNDSSKKRYKSGSSKGKKIAIISSVSAAVVVILCVTGFCLFQSGIFEPRETGVDFTYDEDTKVSGISIGGKTMLQAKELLESKKENFIREVTFLVDTDGDVTTLTQNDFEYTYDIEEVLATVKNDTINPPKETTAPITYEITATPTEDSIQTNAKKIEKTTNRDAKDAYVTKFKPYDKNRFEYAEAENGRKLNTADLEQKLTDAFSQDSSEYRIVADVETVDAEVNVDFLKDNIKKLSSYETVSTNTANGTENMRVSLEACNGSVIEPGATWSFNTCTGDSNLESNGYKSANVISEGQITQGIGGGICQSSSTIYNAAIRANMTVEERYNHKWASGYVPTGLDATIDYPRLDLKLSNPTDYQMFMECKLVNSTLYVSIWGVKTGDYDEIKTENEMTDKSSSSYTVKAWRVYFKDGKEIDRESLDSSSYDSDHGYLFIAADNDSNAKNTNVDDVTEPPTTKPSSSSSSKPSSSSSSKPSSSSATEKPTEAPTQAPTEAPEPTEPLQSAPEPEEEPEN